MVLRAVRGVSPDQQVLKFRDILLRVSERSIGQQFDHRSLVSGTVETRFLFFGIAAFEGQQGFLEALKARLQRYIEKSLFERLRGAFQAHRQFHG